MPGLPMRAECGGSLRLRHLPCVCGSRLAGQRVGERNEEEAYTLDGAFNVQDNSRLSCQIVFKPELDGLTMTLTQDATG